VIAFESCRLFEAAYDDGHCIKPLEATDNCDVTIGGQWSRTFDRRVLPGAGVAPIADATSFGNSLSRLLACQGLRTQEGYEY
jgi:hypothetical protein